MRVICQVLTEQKEGGDPVIPYVVWWEVKLAFIAPFLLNYLLLHCLCNAYMMNVDMCESN